jgi:hypothetical protein
VLEREVSDWEVLQRGVLQRNVLEREVSERDVLEWKVLSGRCRSGRCWSRRCWSARCSWWRGHCHVRSWRDDLVAGLLRRLGLPVVLHVLRMLYLHVTLRLDPGERPLSEAPQAMINCSESVLCLL